MRLDEWQKYIGSQFLDDEEEAIPKPQAMGQTQKSEALTTAPALSPLPFTELAQEWFAETQADFLPSPAMEPPRPQISEPRVTETPMTGARPETTPNAIQNVVTMVVAPPVQPEPANLLPRAPRIELLTPLPEQTTATTRPEPFPDVTNRTRRRSQSANPASLPKPENASFAGDNSAPLPSSGNDAAPILPDAPLEASPFQPVLDLGADVPSFAQYLPASHAASVPVSGSPSTQSVNMATPPALSEEETALETTDDAIELSKALLTDKALTSVAPAEESETLQDTGNPRRNPRSRARHARNIRPESVPSGLSAAELWATVPRHVQTLLALERLEEEQEVAQFSYKRPFQEKRHELIERLLDPILSLEDAARLLNVCPTTVRRYTNKGILTYYRKEPERATRSAMENGSSGDKETRQRRFRLSDILAFLETQQAALVADRQAERSANLIDADFALDSGKEL